MRWRIARSAAEPLSRADYLTAATLGVIAAIVSLWLQTRIPVALSHFNSSDVWFDADISRVLAALGDRTSDLHFRTGVHPLFSLVSYPLAALLKGLGLSLAQAAGLMVGSCALASTGLLYLCLRRLDRRWWEAALACAVFMTSATFFHWYSVVESYAFAPVAALGTLFLFLGMNRRSDGSLVAASALSLSMTVTNWSLALALAILRFPLVKAVRYSAVALGICMVLAFGQSLLFPEAWLFFKPSNLAFESKYVQLPQESAHRSPADVVRSVLVSSAVAPEPYLRAEPDPDILVVDNQSWNGAYPWTSVHYGPVGVAAVALWLAMLALSAWGFVRAREISFAIVGAALFMAGQIALHLVYGATTFLYAANYYPMLLVLAATGCTGRLRHMHTAIMAALVVIGGWANFEALQTAIRLVEVAT